MKKKSIQIIGRTAVTLCLAIASASPLYAKSSNNPWKNIPSWAWNTKNTDDLSFPTGFLWGSSTSAQQVEGNCTNNSWAVWEKSFQGKQVVKAPAGIACDHWNRYKEDIARMRELGLTAYRFSVEWSKIEPQEGVFDRAALDHYRDVCKELVANGITPIVVFHHYTEPIWFLNKHGFERAQNLHYFTRFCTTVFNELKDVVGLWTTFNSPTSYVMHCYHEGEFYPGKKDDYKMAMDVLYNMLCAHADVYHAIKALPGGAQAKVGITHNIFQVEPKHRKKSFKSFFKGAHFKNARDSIKSKYARHMMNESVFNFFLTGKFVVDVPTKVHKNYHNMRAKGALDFVGLNYYSRGIMAGSRKRNENEITTDNSKYTICAEGFYAAIKEISECLAKPLNIPIYVTENGIATTEEWKRDLFYRRYLYAMSEAIKQGHNVRGYCTWAFMDTYSWKGGMSNYGLLPVDRNTLERGELKEGAKHYIAVVNRFKA